MKSPWKILAQFIPQRRSAEASASSIGHDPDTERSQGEAPQSSDLPLDATEAPRGNEHEESRLAELKTWTAPAHHEAIRSTPKSAASRVESGPGKKSQRTPATTKPKPAKTTRATRADTIAPSAAAARDKADLASSSRDAFFEEAAGLDEDIKQLRIQLARKLHLQNDQLKKMLERFDVS